MLVDISFKSSELAKSSDRTSIFTDLDTSEEAVRFASTLPDGAGGGGRGESMPLLGGLDDTRSITSGAIARVRLAAGHGEAD